MIKNLKLMQQYLIKIAMTYISENENDSYITSEEKRNAYLSQALIQNI